MAGVTDASTLLIAGGCETPQRVAVIDGAPFERSELCISSDMRCRLLIFWLFLSYVQRVACIQRAAGVLCNVRALAFRLISWPEPSRLGPLRSMVCDSVSLVFSLLFSLMDSSFMERFLPAGCDFGGLVFNGG